MTEIVDSDGVNSAGQSVLDATSGVSIQESLQGSLLVRSILEEFSTTPGDLSAILNRPVPAGYRYAYDRYASGFYFVDPDDLAATAMSGTQLTNVNREANANSLNLVCNDLTDTIRVGFVFAEQTTITHYMVVSTNDLGQWINVQVSLNTTNGFDGVWTTIDAVMLGAFYDGNVNPHFRTRAAGLAGAANVKGIRFSHTNDINFDVRAIHLYGAPGSLATTTRLAVWDPVLDQPAVIEALDFGDSPKSSSKELRFRLKNVSASAIATATSVAVESITDPGPGPDTSAMFLFSKDNGITFAAAANVGTLSPGQISVQVLARLVVPNNADLGTWCARVVGSSGGGVNEVSFYIYLGDVSSNVPTPHLWYVYPPSEFRGGVVTLIGQGFGTSQAVVNGQALYDGIPVTVNNWAQTAAGVHAYDNLRVIQSSNDVVNVEHERIDVVVPVAAVDDYFSVRTDI